MPTNPYAGALGSENPQAVLASTSARLAAIYDDLTDEQIETPPAPGKWNLRQIMCHLADCEVAWAWRLRYAFEKPHAVLQPFDQDPWAALYSAYTLAEARATFFALRAWNVTFINALSPADKAKPVTHPELGEWTLWTIVEMMAGHDLHHLTRLETQFVPTT